MFGVPFISLKMSKVAYIDLLPRESIVGCDSVEGRQGVEVHENRIEYRHLWMKVVFQVVALKTHQVLDVQRGHLGQVVH
jgi:hypothetical protein